MTIHFLRGPILPNAGNFPNDDDLLLEFAPFTKYSMTETDLRRLQTLSSPRRLWGRFDGAPIKQLLYFFSENLLDGAFISSSSEKEIYRLAETAKRPLYLTMRSILPEDLLRAERLPATGLYLPLPPSESFLRQRGKPCAISLEESEEPLRHWEGKRLSLLFQGKADVTLIYRDDKTKKAAERRLKIILQK